MTSMVLKSNYIHKATFIPNLFIDKYMPAANGAYVKVYLYLMRCLSDDNTEEIDITFIADRLDNTESDIIRALCYWEKVKLLTLTRDDKDNITSITVNNIDCIDNDVASEDEPAATIDYVGDDHSTSLNTINANNQEELNTLNDDTIKQYQFDKPTYSDSQIKQITDDDDVKWMLNIIEVYLQRLIKPMDLQLILYLYESLDFSTELILYLYEYCVSRDKTHPSYVEAVAVSWAKDGIDTLEKAEAATASYNESYNSVKKAFGLDRALGHVEKQYVNKWSKEYQFPTEIIVEACNKTLLAIQKPDFKYTDKIIENWHKDGVNSLKDIKNLDEEHKKTFKTSKSKETINKNNNKNQGSNNKFNTFPQRSYSKEDYSSLEKKLLNRE